MAVTGAEKQVALMTTAGDELSGKQLVRHMRWVGGTTSGHSLVVTDSGGTVIWESIADGANYIDVHPFYRFFSGVKIQTMQSGRLYVYLS